MHQYTTDELIDGVLSQDVEVIGHLYKSTYRDFIWLVRRNHGHKEDAEDILHEAMVILFKKIASGNFELTCSPKTFLYAVGRNLWLKELGKRARYKPLPEEEMEYCMLEEEIELTDNKDIRSIYMRHFLELTEECKKILHLHLKRMPIGEITQRMGFKSDSYTTERKYRCKRSLIKRILANPQFRRLNEG